MRIEKNSTLIARNKRIAQWLFFASLGVLVVGFIVINQPVQSDEMLLLSFILPLIILPAAFITTVISVRMTNLWIRQPRPEEVIEANLKGISTKSVLYHYYHFPARHVLISPQGIFAIVTYYQEGRFGVEGDRWRSYRGALGTILSLFRFDRLGNPTANALAAAEKVKKVLGSIAPDVVVYPLILFVDPRAQVELENPTVPVVFGDPKSKESLKEYLKDKLAEGKKGSAQPSMPLTPEQIEAFEEATL